MKPKISKTGCWKGICNWAGVVALLVLLPPGLAGAVDLTVDGGNTLWVPPSITYDNETIGDTGQGALVHLFGSNTVNTELTLGNTATGTGAYKLYFGSLAVGNIERIGNAGTGAFTQFGGTHTLGDILALGILASGHGAYHLKGGSLAVGEEFIGRSGTGVFNQSGGTHTVANTLTLAQFAGSSGTYNLKGGKLTAGTIRINPNLNGTGAFNVMNTITTVTGNVINDGTVKTTNAIVTWNGNFTNNGAYISDPSVQTFTNLAVLPTGYIAATHSQDLFIIKNDFFNQSAQGGPWDTAQAQLKFATGADNIHEFRIPGDDNGNHGTNDFAWRLLNITGQTLNLLDGDGGTGALYVQALLGAVLSGSDVTNISETGGLNIYYNPDLLANFYLHGLTYDLAGTGGGQLIPYHTPVPASVFLLGSGLLGLGLLGYRRKRG